MKRRQIADRLFLTILSLVVVAVAFLEPQSLSYTLMRIGGTPVRLCMGILLGLAIIAAADTIVNDILPDRFRFHSALRLRQGIWMVIGVTYVGMAFVIVKYGSGYGIALIYVIYAMRACAISFLDLYYEYRDTIEERARLQGKNPDATLPGALSDD